MSELKFQVPFTCLVVGPTTSGKTMNMCKWLSDVSRYEKTERALRHKEDDFNDDDEEGYEVDEENFQTSEEALRELDKTDSRVESFNKFEKVIVCAPMNDKVNYLKLAKICRFFKYIPRKVNKGFNEVDDLLRSKRDSEPWLLILDDCQDMSTEETAICTKWMTQVSHHKNVSVVAIQQYSSSPTRKAFPIIKNNVHYLFCFRMSQYNWLWTYFQTSQAYIQFLKHIPSIPCVAFKIIEGRDYDNRLYINGKAVNPTQSNPLQVSREVLSSQANVGKRKHEST